MKIFSLFIFLLLISNIFAMQKCNWQYNKVQGLKILINESIVVQRTLFRIMLKDEKLNKTSELLPKFETNIAKLEQISAELDRMGNDIQCLRDLLDRSIQLQEKYLNEKRNRQHA